jgi:hypothetical protein
MPNAFDSILSNVKEQVGTSANTITKSVLNADSRLNQEIPLSADAIGNRIKGLIAGGSNSVQNLVNNVFVPNDQDPLPRAQPVSFQLQDDAGHINEAYTFNMFVNPASWQVDWPSKTVTQVKTLGGIQLQYWYPELGAITANGIIGNMLTARNSSSMLKSNAWLGFQQLLKIYLDNGITNFRNQGLAKIGQVPFRPTVVITYYGYTYYGYFESFSLTENEENPFTRDYSFAFKFFNHATGNIAEESADPGYVGNLTNGLNALSQSIAQSLPGGLPSNPTAVAQGIRQFT